MIQFESFSDNGRVLNFSYAGPPIKVKIKILDGYTKLVFFTTFLDVYSDVVFFVSTEQNVVHKIYEIYDEHETQCFFKTENFEGDINITDNDPLGYFKDIGLKCKSNHLLAIPLYEIFCNKLYNHFKCRVKDNDVVVDVGANIGFFTYKSLYDGAKFIYSIEPNEKLSNVIRSHNFTNVHIDNIALSDKTHSQKFYIDSSGISSCLESFVETFQKESEQPVGVELTTVQAVDVMDYILDNNISKIDLLKLDCEGSEYAIIDRIEESYLKFNIDRMVVEYHYLDKIEYKNMYHKMIEKIYKCGFKIDGVDNVVNCGLLFCWKE